MFSTNRLIDLFWEGLDEEDPMLLLEGDPILEGLLTALVALGLVTTTAIINLLPSRRAQAQLAESIARQDAFDVANHLPRQGREMAIITQGTLAYVTRPDVPAHPEDMANRETHAQALSGLLDVAIQAQDAFDRAYGLPRQGRLMVVFTRGIIRNLNLPMDKSRGFYA